jgi:hypothetical protein
MSVCDFRLSPLSRTELRYCAILTLRTAVILYRRFGTAYGFHLLFLDLTLEDRKIGCPETSVRNYQFAPRNVQEERRIFLGVCYISLAVSGWDR